MSQSSTATASLVRLSVTAGTRRADLGLPGGIPVAELVPELARELGQLDLASAATGFRLVRHDGIGVDPDLSLAAQGIQDGFVLSLESAGEDLEVKVYDDVVEAVADLVESQFAPWTPENSARTALGASVTLFIAGALALFLARSHGALIAAVAGAVALLLVTVAAVLGHARGKAVAAASLAIVATLYAGVAGSALLSGGDVWQLPLLIGGAAMALVGVLGVAAAPRHRPFVAAAASVGATLAVDGALTTFTGWPVAGVAAVTFAVAVIAGNLLPWFAISSVRLTSHPPRSDAEIYADVPRVERAAVRRQVRQGHELQLGLGTAAGLVALACTPHIAGGGVLGAALGAVGFVAVLLRTRHSRARSTVLASMLVGILGLAVLSTSAAVSHPTWRPWVGVGLATAAGLVVALALLAPRTRVRLGRVADALDGACLVALLPLSLAAAGVF